METTTIEMLQVDGADATLATAKTSFEKVYPHKKVTKAEFKYAYPADANRHRMVGIEITFEIVSTSKA